jgi:hypothetical protein
MKCRMSREFHRQQVWHCRKNGLLENTYFSEEWADFRELRTHGFLGPTGHRPGVCFSNTQHPVCTGTYKHQGLTTYTWLYREKNRYATISCCLFLSSSVPKIKSCHLVEKKKN